MSSPWTMRAGSGLPVRATADLDTVRRALAVFADPEAGIQLQYAPFHSQNFATFPGSDIDSQVDWVRRHDEQTALYYALNPVPLTLAHSLKSSEVLRRRWLLIDVDRDKTESPDDSATDLEKEQTKQTAWAVSDHLTGEGFPLPVVVDSGNGWHLLYRIDQPNNALAREMIKALLEALAGKWPGVDVKCSDARRVSKLPGTWARKGTESAERPWRLARLVELPAVCEVVSPELIRNVTERLKAPARPPEPPSPTPDTQETLIDLPKPSSMTLTATGGDTELLKAYAKAALEDELRRLASAPVGERNAQLNKTAFSIGQLIAANWSGLNRLDAELSFTECAASIGLDDSEIPKTIRSGIEAGMAKPRPLPDGMTLPKPSKDGRHTKRAATPPDPDEPLTVCLADVMPKAIDWLMPNRIPNQFVTIFAGRTGIGKSSVALDIVARVTTGGEIPCSNGERFKTGNVLIISEDSHEYILAPRLLAAGADMKRVRAMTWKAMGKYTLDDTAMLEKACAEFGGEIALIIIDPPTNFLSDADEHKNSEVRRIVMAIVEWLQDKVGTAVLFITHVNKNCGKGVEALSRVMGSIAWVTTCRIAHSFSSDPDDKSRGLFLPMKTNLGPLGKGLAYRIVTRAGSAGVEWIGEVDTTADEAMAGERKAKPKRRVKAAVWLEELFAEEVEIASDTIYKRMREETTLSNNALKEAKEDMGIKAKQHADDEGKWAWFWSWDLAARNKWEMEKPQEPELDATDQKPDQDTGEI